MAADDFQSKYASLMESMIKSAVAETTKLFETMVDELKAEISTIRKENEHLKIRCRQIEDKKSQPSVETGDTARPPRTPSSSEKRDTAIQCDFVPLQDSIVDNCVEQPEHQQEKKHSSLQKEHHDETHEEENCQESYGDSCSFTEEEENADLTVVCRQVQGSPLPSAHETEGPLIKEVMSLRDRIPLALKPFHLENHEGLQTNTQSREPEHLFVIQQPVTQDANSETLHNSSERAKEGGLTISAEKHLGDYQEKLVVEPPQTEPLVSVCQERQREADVSVNNCVNVTLPQYADVHQEEEQLEVPTTFKNVNCEELQNGLTEGKSSSQPKKSSIQRRGRLSRRAKRGKSQQQQPVKNIQCPSIGDHMYLSEVNTPASTTENSCAVDTSNTGPNPALYVQPKDTISIINPSLQKRRNTELKDVKSSNVGTLPVCSGKEHLPKSRQHLVEMEGEVIPANESSPANKIQHILSPRSSQAPSLRSRGRCTSVTLEDAMLLVEAMYQSRQENAGSSSSTTSTQSQAQGVPSVPALQTVDEVPALKKTRLPPQVEVECSLPIMEQVQPSVETISATCLTSNATQTSESQVPIKVESLQHDVTASRVNLPTGPLSTSVSQARAQISRQIFAPPVITMSATSTTENNPIPHNIFVSSLKAHALSSAQLSAVVSAVVSAQKTNSPPSSTAAAIPYGTPPLSSVPQKTIFITATKPPPVVLAPTAFPSTVNQSIIRPPQKIILIPRQISPVVPQKLILTAKPPEPAPTALASSPLFVSSSQQSSISVNTVNASEIRVTVPPPQIPSLSHQLSTVDIGTVSNKVCAMSQNRDNVSDNLDSQKPAELVSETADGSRERSDSPKTVLPSKSEEALPVVDIPLSNEQKNSVVRLTRLPITVSTEETVVVSRLLPDERKTFIPTQAPSSSEETLLPQVKSRESREQTSSPSDMPESSETCPYLDASQISEDASDSVKPANSASTPSTVSEPAVIGKSELSTTSPCQFSSNDSINSDGAESCVLQNDSVEQQNQSADFIKLSSITPKDASDPHLKMTKSQFLAQLEISPIGQATKEVSCNSSEDISGDNGKNLRKNSLVARLRSHLKAHLRSKRTEAETPLEIETTCVAPKKPKLDNNDPNDKNEDSVYVNPEEFDGSNSIPLMTFGPSENEPITGGSELSADNASLTKDIRKPADLSFGLRLCSSTQETASRKKIDRTSRGPNSSSSKIKINDSAGVSSSKSTFSKRGTTCRFSSISSTPLTRRRSTVSKDVPDAKQVKRKLNAVSPERYSASISKKTNIKTGSPSARWPRLNQDVTSLKKSGESALSKKPRLIKDDTISKNILKVVNAKKLATAAKVNTFTKIKKSNQSVLQIGGKRRQLTENQAGCKDVKKVIVKGIWTPPLLPATEISPTGEAKSKKEAKCQNQKMVYPPTPSLHPIPVRAPPITSPLQPLSVIGGRLLKNQCGECGRVFNTSAALENHVGLHTRSRPFSCKLCGKSFLDSKGLKRHDRVHRNGRVHVCPKCGKGFAYTFCLTKHLQMVHGKVRPFNCKVCKKGFFTKRDMEGHIRIHTGEKPFHCNLCERKFPRRADLNVHLRWHNGEKRHWCPFCGKGFLDFNNLKRHKYIHTGEKPHSCSHCPKRFTQSSHLKKHLKNVHKIQ